MLKTVTLNVGMLTSPNFGKVKAVPRRLIERTLAEHGYTVAKSVTVPGQDGSEDTFVAVVLYGDDVPTAPLAHISTMLAQDCVAVQSSSGGQLLGPYASQWGAFDPDLFLSWQDACERRLSLIDDAELNLTQSAVAAALASIAPRG